MATDCYQPRNRQSRATGFTLIELLAATVLAVILMFAVIRITASINRSPDVRIQQPAKGRGKHVADSGSELTIWRNDLVKVIADDLRTKRQINIDNHRLIIEDLCDVTKTRQDLTHLPTIVHYRLVHRRKLGLLIRRQDELLPSGLSGGGGEGGDGGSIALLAAGVKAFHVNLLYPSSNGPTARLSKIQGKKPTPIAVRIRIRFDNKREPPIHKTFWLNR